MSNNILAAALWIAAGLILILYLARRSRRKRLPGNCNSTNGIVGSSAFIDLSMYLPPNGKTQGRDLCDAIYGVLNDLYGNTYPSNGAVIDARGVSGAANLTWTHGSPWTEGGNTVTAPSTILLPATGALPTNPSNSIVISTSWILPPNTHLIGEGDGIPIFSTGGSLISAPGTTIQAASGFSGSMIQIGAPSPVCPLVNTIPTCTGISVENLTLDGQGQSINGITNAYSQDATSVNHVSLYQIRGVGLLIEQGSSGGNATNSGPYSNITFDTGSYQGTTGTVCAQILNAGSTHGIHGLSCAAETNDAPAAVLLDSSNNSIEDVRIVGFYDGISVGKNAPAQSNVLLNIIGDTARSSGPTPVRVIHIQPGNTVTDLSIMGLENMGGTGTYTLWDDLTGPQLSDPSVGIYALGDSVNGGYSRYTTSPNLPTWVAGPNFPSGSSCARGSLYSCTGGSMSCDGAALWACALYTNGVLQWLAVR